MAAAALLALAAQVVTLQAADLEAKAAYVRIGVGVESRLTLPEPAVRVRGQQSAKELLGLRLGQVRPKGVLLLRPRAAGTARLVFEGATHRIRLDIEASMLGTAQEVVFRIGEPVAAAATPAPPPSAPPKQAPPGKTAFVPTPQPAREPAATARKAESKPAPARKREGDPSPLPARSAQAADRKRGPRDTGKAPAKPHVAAGAPTAAASPMPAQPAAPTPPPSLAAAEPSAGPGAAVDGATEQQIADAGPAALPTDVERRAGAGRAAAGAPSEGKRQVARIDRYVGMPGQRGVWVEALVREGARVSLRLRVEGGAGAVEIGALDIEGTPATVRTEVVGRDLVIIGEVPLPAARPREATLGMTERGKFRREKLKLVGPGLADLLFDGGRAW